MGKSVYPNGFPNGVSIRNMPLAIPYGGNIFWVDSGAGSNSNKGTERRPFDTLDYAVGRCTANNGDIIFVKAGHVETVTAAGGLDLDVAGITIVFLGEGTDKAYVTFTTDTGADMDVDAANITLINPRFVAGKDALTGPIDVNSTDFTILNGEYHDGTTIDTIDCVVATSGATRLTIDGWRYYKGDEGGATPKESNIQLDGVDEAWLRNIHISGAFNAGNIENVTDEVLDIYMENIYLKNTDADPSPCMVIDADATGFAKNVHCRIASGTTFVSNVGKINWADDCLGYNADGGAGDPIGTAIASGLEGKIDVIDGYHDVPVADTSDNAVMRDVIGNKDDAAAAGAVTTSESIMAYVKQVVGGQIIIDAFHDVPVADTSDNAQMRDVVGNKDDAAAAGAVTTSESIMAYVKQLVGGQIVIDAFHDVPVADTSDNAQMRDVVGNKNDAAAAGAVTTSESIMAYVKQVVGGQIIIDGFHDVPTADTSDNAQMRDVVGNKDDAAATGAVTTSESLMAYIKQLVTDSDSLSALNSRYFEVHADFTSATWGTTANTHEVVTVTGPCRVRMLARCSSSIVANAALLMQLGTSASTTAFIANTTASMIDTGEFWISSTTNSNVAYIAYGSVMDNIVNGQDIGYALSGHADGATGGGIVFHVWWEPLDAAATCAAGAGGTLT